MSKKILGLDLGAASIGWSIIDEEENYIIDSGVRVFEAGVEDLGTTKEKSKNVQRREARQKRRQTFRKKRRLEYLKDKLTELNFINDSKELENEFIKNPYQLRAKALDEKITLSELSRIFYQFTKRRGFKKNETSMELNDENSGSTKEDPLTGLKLKSKLLEGSSKTGNKGAGEIVGKLNDFRTIGEYFSSLNTHETRIRKWYTVRKFYKDEFDKIWEKQSEYHPELNQENKKLIWDAIDFQYPLKSQKNLIGKCLLEPEKRRVSKEHPLFQEFSMYQDLNNLLFTKTSRPTNELTESEREKFIEMLSNTDKIDIGPKNKSNLTKIKKILEHNSDKVPNFNLTRLHGLKFRSKIKDAFGKKFTKETDEKLEEIYSYLRNSTDYEKLSNHFKNKYELNEDEIEKIKNIKFSPNYGSLSVKAINKVLPFLKQGMLYHEAREAAGYTNIHQVEIEEKEQIEATDMPKIANPVVTVALHELRKVVNSLIAHYGRPDQINIEMARDLKMSADDRKELIFKNREREKANNEARNELKKAGLQRPTRDDIQKYHLWKEAKEECPFSGKVISLAELITGGIEVEHIIPYSKSLDNSMANKTICIREENDFKGNRTPRDAYELSKPDQYREILDRVRKNLPHNKFRKFQTTLRSYSDKIEEKFGKGSDFISTQLNDTRYISREASKLLKVITPNIQVVTGNTTAYLRKFWGLNSVIPELSIIDDLPKHEKSRLDHRHHAVDSIVVAMTSRSALQRMSKYNRIYGEYHSRRRIEELSDTFAKPWENFLNDVKESISNIIISHKVKRKISGQLHEDTYYGLRKDLNGEIMKDHKGQKLYTVRKPIESLTYKMITQIADPNIKETILDRLEQNGISKNESKRIEAILSVPIYHTSIDGKKRKVKKVRIRVPLGNARQVADYNKHADPGNNFATIIYKNKIKDKVEGEVITLWDAVKLFKKFSKDDKIEYLHKKFGDDVEYICSFQKDEMFLLGDFPEGFDIIDKSTYHLVSNQMYRIQKMTNSGQNSIINHLLTTAKYDIIRGKEYLGTSFFPKTMKGIKLKIDHAGFLEVADD